MYGCGIFLPGILRAATVSLAALGVEVQGIDRWKTTKKAIKVATGDYKLQFGLACPMDVDVLGYISALKQGNIEKAARLSFDGIQCGLCAS